MMHQTEQLLEQKQWPAAKTVLQRLVELYPGSTGPDSAYGLLALAHRALGETNAEREVLSQLAERDDEAIDAYLRLMVLGAEAQDWPSVEKNARRYLAVNPLVAPPYRYLAQASEKTREPQLGIRSYQSLLQLDPPDLAEAHFHLAQLLHQTGDPAANRHVLQALEEAPRYREALRLLLQLNQP